MPDEMILCFWCGSLEPHEWEPVDRVWICKTCGNVVEDEDVDGNPMQSYNEQVAHVCA